MYTVKTKRIHRIACSNNKVTNCQIVDHEGGILAFHSGYNLQGRSWVQILRYIRTQIFSRSHACVTLFSHTIIFCRPFAQMHLNLNKNTLYILSLVFMFPEKGFFTSILSRKGFSTWPSSPLQFPKLAYKIYMYLPLLWNFGNSKFFPQPLEIFSYPPLEFLIPSVGGMNIFWRPVKGSFQLNVKSNQAKSLAFFSLRQFEIV